MYFCGNLVVCGILYKFNNKILCFLEENNRTGGCELKFHYFQGLHGKFTVCIS